ARAAFALCRPPGHHAGREYMGGYCYLNNAAIAAQHGIAQGAARVAVLDVDFHHGNGTQDIFYERADVLFASIHGEPHVSYPYFSGYADERGAGAGEGFNLNLPLPKGTQWDTYATALGHAADAIVAHAPDLLVVSLGVDTFEHDPISHFRLRSPDYLRIGEALARLNLPTLFVMEGGYMVEEIGINAVNVLLGFEGRA
ncbi:histone deacetylase family protein, partial [Burkholderia stabilis]